MTDSDAQWIKAARKGDQLAFRRLVEANARPMHRACQRILGDAAAAEDALQDAFLAAWRGLDKFDGRSAVSSWLHRIAINAALMQLRGRRVEVSLDADDAAEAGPMLPDAHEDPFEHASGHQFGQRLGSALDALSASERAAFVLRHFEQCAMEEIAESLGSNVNACKQSVFRAVRKLRGALTPMRNAS